MGAAMINQRKQSPTKTAWVLLAALVAALSSPGAAFAGEPRQTFIGTDITTLIDKYGEPIEIEDITDGMRHYTFRTKVKEWNATVQLPQLAGASGLAPVGAPFTVGGVTYQAARLTNEKSNSKAVSVPLGISGGCVLPLIAKRDGDKWIVINDRFAQKPLCMGAQENNNGNK
jgi:hypothetical protein